MKLRKGRLCAALAVLAFVAAAGTGCAGKVVGTAQYGNNTGAQIQEIPEATTTAEPTTEPPVEDKRVHVVAAGDNLIHYSVFKNALNYSDDGTTYNFLPMYENVRDIVESADLSILNQETIISQSNQVVGGNGGYLLFNSPPEVAYSMIDLGFDVFTMANNHLLDMGAAGLEESLTFWDGLEAEHGVTALGAYHNEADMRNIRTREVNGVTIAFLAYAEHINGFSIPADSPLRVVMNHETDVIESQIKEANEIADVVIVSAHWGVEDTHVVSEDRKTLAQNMVNWGADVIIGCHTHTAETMEFLTRPDGTQGFVYYSLGNFICAQTDNFNLVGELADFDIVVDGETNEVTLENVGAIPTIVHYDDGNFSNMRIYPYSMYTAELAAGHGVPYAPWGTAKDFSMDVVNRIVEENIPEEFRKLDR